MAFHTSHAALLAMGGSLLAAVISPICGHTVDPNIFTVSTGFSIVLASLDWADRHFGNGSGSQIDPLAVQ